MLAAKAQNDKLVAHQQQALAQRAEQVWCLVSGVWCLWRLASGVWCLVSGVWRLVSGVWRLAQRAEQASSTLPTADGGPTAALC
jgi:hypothetical protein